MKLTLSSLSAVFVLLDGAVSSVLGSVYSDQLLSSGQHTFSQYDSGLFTPLGDLSSLSSSEFAILGHPAFPRHSVRIKQTDFCDGTVSAYTGYIDVQARHLFFYFFESRRDPDTDDVLFWTNGGPGASSSMGLFMELGPCRVTSSDSTEFFPYSWNNHANTFFVDQPVGVGFSYADYGESVGTTQEAADDIAAFMVIFFEHFTKFKGRPLHLAGESYGGRYIPVFAAAIYDKNAQLIEAGMTPVNLSSVMIGNGCTDFATMFPSYYDAQCQDPTFPAVQGIADCVRMKQLVPRCIKRYQEACVDTTDPINCADAASFCGTAMSELFSDLNHYDRARPCKGAANITMCYPIVQHIGEFLNNPTTQKLLGVDSHKGNFSRSSPAVSAAFRAHLDSYGFPAQYYLAALLERGIPALVYVGATDYICNWIGNERMTLALEWSKQDEFRSQPLKEWIVNGKAAGVVRSGGGLTFATIAGAGHMAPYDKPIESLELAKRWLAGKEL